MWYCPSLRNPECELYRPALVSACLTAAFTKRITTASLQMVRGRCHGGCAFHSSLPTCLRGKGNLAAMALAVVILAHAGIACAQGSQASTSQLAMLC